MKKKKQQVHGVKKKHEVTLRGSNLTLQTFFFFFPFLWADHKLTSCKGKKKTERQEEEEEAEEEAEEEEEVEVEEEEEEGGGRRMLVAVADYFLEHNLCSGVRERDRETVSVCVREREREEILPV